MTGRHFEEVQNSFESLFHELVAAHTSDVVIRDSRIRSLEAKLNDFKLPIVLPGSLPGEMPTTAGPPVRQRLSSKESLKEKAKPAGFQSQGPSVPPPIAVSTTDDCCAAGNEKEEGPRSRGVTQNKQDTADSLVVDPQRTSESPPAATPHSNSSKITFKSIVGRIRAAEKSKKAFDIRPVYNMPDEQLHLLQAQRRSGACHTIAGQPGKSFNEKDFQRQKEGDWFMIHPEAALRIVWNLSACFLLFYSVIVIPLSVFDPELHPFLVAMEWINIFYWTGDIVMSFITGFYSPGGVHIVLKFRPVAQDYLRRWFTFDMSVLIAEWILLIMETVETAKGGAAHSDEAGGAVGLARTMRAARFVRVVRYLRLVRLIRLLKIQGVFEVMKEKLNNEFVLIFLTLWKWGVFVMFLGHASACIWYAAGSGEQGWADQAGIVGNSLGDRYFASYQWSLTRLHPTNLNRLDGLHNTSEKLFSLCATFSALGLSSIFVSLVTNKMAEMKRQRLAKDTKIEMIRSYAQKHNISTRLTLRLKRHVTTSYVAQLRATEEADLMRILPASMLVELRFETWSPLLRQHVYFSKLQFCNERTEINVCHRAIREDVAFKDDLIFCSGDPCSRAIFPLFGTFFYMPSSTGSEVNVILRKCLCEAALWTPWHHLGDLLAVLTGSIASVLSDELADVVSDNPQTLADTVAYARDFLSKLNAHPNQATDLPQAVAKLQMLFARPNHKYSKMDDNRFKEATATDELA